MSMVAERYAKALLDLAIADGAVEEYQNELEAVSQTYEAENGLCAFLLSPQKDLTAKQSVLAALFRGRIEENILRFLLLLLEKGRVKSLPDICCAYLRMADEYRNILNITVAAAFPLDETQAEGIGRTFQSVYHAASVKITVETDSSLIGGVKVTVGDQVYDGTVKGKLVKMQSSLTEQ